MPEIGEQKRVGDVVGRWDGSTWRRVPQQEAADVDANVGTVLGPNYHPREGESPLSAMFGELARTGGRAVKGFAKGLVDLPTLLAPILHPVDTLEGGINAVKHPIDTLTNAVGSMVADPEVAGHALGTTVLGAKGPGLALKGARMAPALASRAAGAVGRGLEAAGNSTAARLTGRFGPGAVLMHPSPAGAAVSAAAIAGPPALRGLGRVLQKFGPAAKEAGAAAGDAALSLSEQHGLPPPGARVPASIMLRELGKLPPEVRTAIMAERQAALAGQATTGKTGALQGLENVVDEAPAGARRVPQSTEVPYRMGEPTQLHGLNEPPPFADPLSPNPAIRQPRGPRPMGPSSLKPDLMDEFQATQGPKETFEMDGKNYRMNEQGSHVADVEPGDIKFNNAETNQPASLKALNDLVEGTPDMAPGELQAGIDAPPSPQSLGELARMKNHGVRGPARDMQPGEFQSQLMDSLGGEDVLSPLDRLSRLSRLSRLRARGQSFRNYTPLDEAY